MEIVQAVRKLNSILRERLNFRRRPILCTTLHTVTRNRPVDFVTASFTTSYSQSSDKQLCIETLYKRATPVAHLTNFSLEFVYAIFPQDVPLLFLYHGVKKNDQKTQIKRVP